MHRYPFMVREHHLDTLGHVNHATYLQLAEEARWELLHEHGFTISWIQEHRIGPVILNVNIRYLREMRLRQKILIETEGLGFRGKIGKLIQTFRSEDQEEMARAEISFGVIDMERRKLLPLSGRWLEVFGDKPLEGD